MVEFYIQTFKRWHIAPPKLGESDKLVDVGLLVDLN
jgi:hypothetical protein